MPDESPEDVPAAPEPIVFVCVHCGDELQNKSIAEDNEDWLCPSCGRYQDTTICPTCGSVVRASLLAGVSKE